MKLLFSEQTHLSLGNWRIGLGMKAHSPAPYQNSWFIPQRSTVSLHSARQCAGDIKWTWDLLPKKPQFSEGKTLVLQWNKHLREVCNVAPGKCQGSSTFLLPVKGSVMTPSHNSLYLQIPAVHSTPGTEQGELNRLGLNPNSTFSSYVTLLLFLYP